jgi:hypothetical protein
LSLLQVQKVSSELAEYKAESKAIKNQDLTIRKQVCTAAARNTVKQQAAARMAAQLAYILYEPVNLCRSMAWSPNH